MGQVILNASETWTGTVHFKCLVMFTNVFLYIYLMHWSDSRRHLCCLDTQYGMDAGKLFFFFLSFVFVHVHTNVSPHPSCIFRTESLTFTNILCFLFGLKSSCTHQIKILMARHPFKNPLKALVTFQAICFCGFCFIHLIQKNSTKHQQL